MRCVSITPSQRWPDFSFISAIQMERAQTSSLSISRDAQHSCSNLNYSLSVQQHAYLLRVFPFLLIFLLQEVADDLKEVLWRWWKGKKARNTPTQKYYRHCSKMPLKKSWHINTMHSKRTVMDNKLTFLIAGISIRGKNDRPLQGSIAPGKFDTETMMVSSEKKDGIWGISSDKNTPRTPCSLQ